MLQDISIGNFQIKKIDNKTATILLKVRKIGIRSIKTKLIKLVLVII